MKKWLVGGLILLITLPGFAQKRRITLEDLWKMKRLNEFVLSPDGQWIAYTLTEYSMETNSAGSDLYLVSTSGGSPRQMTTHPEYDGNPCWSPDGSLLSFISDRDGSRQIYVISIHGGEAQRISSIPSGVSSFIWSPDGRYFAFTSQVKPEPAGRDSLQYTSLSEKDEDLQARVFDHLLFRHWNKWLDGTKSHLFVMPAAGGNSWDITPGDFDTPPISLGSGRDYAFSPDGQEIAFVRNTDSLVVRSTNNDIFVVPAKGGTIKRISYNPANDNQPVYSPDGTYIAFRAMRRPGFEADQYDMMLYNRSTGRTQNLTAEFDLDVGEIIWSPDARSLYFTSLDQGANAIFRVDIRNSKKQGILLEGSNSNIAISPEGNQLFFLRDHVNLPDEIFNWDLEEEKYFQLTFSNRPLLDQLEMNSLMRFQYPSFDGQTVYGFLLKPPFFDPVQTYPAILLIHGGPQSAWKDEFHYRWNAQVFASRGYIVLMINPRGSKGYGQGYCDAVSRNWGGTPYRDLMAGLDHLIKKHTFIHPQKIAAAGASYGGYMVNWIAGQTDRFRCLVSHDGISNTVSFYGTTEELWFPEWEFNGTPYENERQYEKWSPIRNAKDFKTPMLVIHGQNDFRTSLEQGLQMFTALQRNGVPSRFLYFPDEGHLVLKPRNSRLWYNTVLDWIDYWMGQDDEN
jgi:dipeptidyl aminopeptidase/acylaminoacyl peptidase